MTPLVESMAALPNLDARLDYMIGVIKALEESIDHGDGDRSVGLAYAAMIAEIRERLSPPPESRTWIRQLREEIENVGRVSPVAVEREERILVGFDRLVAEMTAAEDIAAQKIAAFLEHLADRAASYHVATESPVGLRAAAQDVRDGRWRDGR